MLPLSISPDRNGFGPQLSLNSGSATWNGLFGLGSSLSQPSIGRETEKGLPQYQDHDDTDTSILAGAGDPVPFSDEVGRQEQDEPVVVYKKSYSVRRYWARIEGAFARIERWSRAGDARVDVVKVSPDWHVDWHPLLFPRPRMTFFVIDADGRRGALHELRPFEAGFGDISSLGLVDAARVVRQAERLALSRRRTRGEMDFVK